MSQERASLIVLASSVPKTRGARDQARRVMEKNISLEQLRRSYSLFMSNLRQVFRDGQDGRVGDFLLEEISFEVEIGAEGEFKLIGTGVGVTARSGVTFTLRRQELAEVSTHTSSQSKGDSEGKQ